MAKKPKPRKLKGRASPKKKKGRKAVTSKRGKKPAKAKIGPTQKLRELQRRGTSGALPTGLSAAERQSAKRVFRTDKD